MAQKKNLIKGTIDKRMENKMISMYFIFPSYSSLKRPPVLETVIKNGKFLFETNIRGFELYGFYIDHNGERYSQMIGAVPQNIKVDFLDTLLKTYRIRDNGFQKKYEKASKELSSFRNDTALLVKCMEKYIKTPFATSFLFGFSYKISEHQIVRLDNLVPEIYKQNSWSIDLKILETKFLIGKLAPNFTQLNPDGKSINLSDYKGKYILLDFWASWCIPCRAENPNLLKAYEGFNKKGFEILSVSLDTKRIDWVEAIKKDRLNWEHVSDLRGWGNSVSKNIYKVISIPQNYLIDPNGKVIAKNLFKNELYDFLDKLKF